MSQQKVDYKKELKANRKKEVKKRKVESKIATIIVAVILVALIYWGVNSAIDAKERYEEANPQTAEIDLSSLSDFSAEE